MATEKKNSVNRKEAREKARRAEKLELLLWRVGLIVVAVAFVVGVGVTFVNMYKDYRDSQPNYERTEMVVGDLANVLSAAEATEAETEGVDVTADEAVTEAETVEEAAETEAATEAETVEEAAETEAATEAETVEEAATEVATTAAAQ